jgi:hypothetical protein
MVLQIFAALLFFKYFSICSTIPFTIIIGRFTDGGGGGSGAKSQRIYKEWPPPLNSHWSLPVTGEGVGWSP